MFSIFDGKPIGKIEKGCPRHVRYQSTNKVDDSPAPRNLIVVTPKPIPVIMVLGTAQTNPIAIKTNGQ